MYYLMIVQNNNTQAVYAYSSLNDALAAFHQELAYRGEGRESTLCTIVNENGILIKSEIWRLSDNNPL